MRIAAITMMFLLALSVAAVADTASGELAGNLPTTGNTIHLDAVATEASGVWTYIYTATITNSSRPVTGFSVQNLLKLEFFDAWNNKDCTNPTFTGADSVFWSGGYILPTGGPVEFGFKSNYGPDIVQVTLFGGARYANGESLGMIPEPASMAGLGALALGGLGAIYRRRKLRRK